MATDYEKLGAFYLGREFDPAANALKDDLVLYDSKDLTTHAVCVGMTGSGKTGLCLSLLEEAAIDGVPAICIDPKGDLGNLLLTFPNLAPGGFRTLDRRRRRATQGIRAPPSSPRRPPRTGRRDWPSGARRRSASPSCAPPPTWLSTRRAPRPACRCRCCVRSRRPPSGRQAQPLRCSPRVRLERTARPRGFGGVGPAEPAGHRGRSDRLARAHPAREHSSRAPGARDCPWTWRR